MKRILIVPLIMLSVSAAQAATHKPRISVAAFDNKANSSHCYHGGNWLGSGFQEQLLTALAKSSKVQIYEREHIDKIYNQEHNLRNRKARGGPRKNQFEAADFTIAGAITSFESCAEGGRTGVSVGRLLNKTIFKNHSGVDMNALSVGLGSEKAKVVLDMRLINVETGEVMRSITAEGTQSRKNVKFATDVYGVGFSHEGFKNTPLGEASRDAIEDAAQKILAALPDQVEDPDEAARAGSSEAPAAALSDGDAAIDLPADSGEFHLDKEIAGYKVVYCSDSFAAHDHHCAAAELIKKLPETKRMEIVDIAAGVKRKVPYAELDKLIRPALDTLQVGDYVLIPYFYNDSNVKTNLQGKSYKGELYKCLIKRVVKSENFVQTSCGGFAEVPPGAIFTSPKLLKNRNEE